MSEAPETRTGLMAIPWHYLNLGVMLLFALLLVLPLLGFPKPSVWWIVGILGLRIAIQVLRGRQTGQWQGIFLQVGITVLIIVLLVQDQLAGS